MTELWRSWSFDRNALIALLGSNRAERFADLEYYVALDRERVTLLASIGADPSISKAEGIRVLEDWALTRIGPRPGPDVHWKYRRIEAMKDDEMLGVVCDYLRSERSDWGRSEPIPSRSPSVLPEPVEQPAREELLPAPIAARVNGKNGWSVGDPDAPFNRNRVSGWGRGNQPWWDSKF